MHSLHRSDCCALKHLPSKDKHKCKSKGEGDHCEKVIKEVCLLSFSRFAGPFLKLKVCQKFYALLSKCKQESKQGERETSNEFVKLQVRISVDND